MKSVRSLARRIFGSPELAGIEHRPTRSLRTVRLGTEYGGWVIPDRMLGRGSVCYCAGAGEDISFDVELVDRFNADVWILDPTPRAIRHFERLRSDSLASERYDRLHYLPVGLWSDSALLRFYAPEDPAHVSHSIVNLQNTASGFDAEVKRLSDVMRELSHDRLDLLKIDIEGAEYRVLDSLIDDHVDARIVCVEYDEWPSSDSPAVRERINSSISRMLAAGFELVELDSRCNALFVRTER